MVLPKAGCFSWLALKHKALSTDRLVKLGIFAPFNCVLCNTILEEVDHIFLQFPFANACSDFVKHKLGWFSPSPFTIWKMLEIWPAMLYKHSLFALLWKVIPSLVVWCIWWERNKRIFFKQTSSIEQVLMMLEKSTCEVVNTYVLNSKHVGSEFIDWDSKQIKAWPSLVIPFKGNRKPNVDIKQDRKNVVWTPPVVGFVKLKFDGASRGNPGQSGAGVVVRNHVGELIGEKSVHLSIGTTNQVEVQALLIGLQFKLNNSNFQKSLLKVTL